MDEIVVAVGDDWGMDERMNALNGSESGEGLVG